MQLRNNTLVHLTPFLLHWVAIPLVCFLIFLFMFDRLQQIPRATSEISVRKSWPSTSQTSQRTPGWDFLFRYSFMLLIWTQCYPREFLFRHLILLLCNNKIMFTWDQFKKAIIVLLFVFLGYNVGIYMWRQSARGKCFTSKTDKPASLDLHI